MYASLGSAMALDSWERFQTAEGHIDTSRSAYIDSADFAQAIDYFSEAIKEDPDYAVAYALRAKTWLWGKRSNIYSQSILEDCQRDICNARKETISIYVQNCLCRIIGLSGSQRSYPC
jgi:tetratricopeptide (TPR) repeat protein